jgi:hypothetical protein
MSPKTPQDFRERAAECERLAETAKNPATRETLLYLASRWRALAEEDEGQSKPRKRKDESPSLG